MVLAVRESERESSIQKERRTMADFPEFNRVQKCRRGLVLYNIHDAYFGRSIELYGEFLECEIALYDQIVRPGCVVFDIGANFGGFTLFFAQKVGPTGMVVAFEPQRVVHQALCANMALNSITNAVCLQMALGGESGTIVVPQLDFTKPNNFGGLELGRFSQGEQVEVRTLDSLNFRVCHFIKLDVEGMERDVLTGATETIARFKPVMYVENDRPEKSDELVRFIDSLGYEMHFHRPPLFNPDNFKGNRENVFGNIVSLNMLCLPKGSNMTLTGFQRVPVP